MNKIYNIYIFLLLVLFACSDVFDDEAIYGCTDKDACNYNENATKMWEGSCEYAIGTCDCDNIPIYQTCDCDGSFDADFDGICDNIDICIGVYDNGYYCSDLHVLDDFKNYNIGSALDSMSVFEIIESSTSIDNGRLTYLALSDKGIYVIPSSISNLDSLETLYLNNNNISTLNSSICNLSILSDFYIYNNQLCDQYKFDCINWGTNDDHWEPQDCNE